LRSASYFSCASPLNAHDAPTDSHRSRKPSSAISKPFVRWRSYSSPSSSRSVGSTLPSMMIALDFVGNMFT
jgi:hypothetical protein